MHTKKSRVRPLRWYIIWYLVFFFFLTTFISLIITLPIWRIREIRVIGSRMISEQIIKDVAKIPLGENLFVADLGGCVSSLKEIPQIKHFGIYRRPPFTIVIKVVEREPFAAATSARETFVIDDEGIILKRSGQKGVGKFKIDPSIENITKLPVIKGIRQECVAADRLKSEAVGNIEKAIARLLKFLEAPSMQIDITDQDDINLLIEDVLRVKLGDTEDLGEKIDNLIVLLHEISGRWNEVDYIDVRYRGVPVIKFRS